MLDEKRIRQMTKLAFFEKKEEKNALRIGRYFRSDYIGKELLKNFFLASIGYILVLAVAVLYHIEWLVDEIDTIDLQFAAGPGCNCKYCEKYSIFDLADPADSFYQSSGGKELWINSNGSATGSGCHSFYRTNGGIVY